MEFYQTSMGKRFYTITLPSIAKSLENIAKAVSDNSAKIDEEAIYRKVKAEYLKEDVLARVEDKYGKGDMYSNID